MKKLMLTSLVLTGFSLGAFAQGTIQWTGILGEVEVQTNSGVASTFTPGGSQTITTGTSSGFTTSSANNAGLGYPGGAGYYYELLADSTAVAAPTRVSALSGWLDTGATGNNYTTAKINQLNPSTGFATATGSWAAGAASGFVLVGWSANLGSTWTAALNNLNNWAANGSQFTGVNTAYFGVSSYGNVISGTGNPGPQLFGTGTGQVANNTAGNYMVLAELQPVTATPEPGTMALAALGGASLLLFRRKK